MVNWMRLKRAKDLGGDSGVRRGYGIDGKPYPRLVIGAIPVTTTSTDRGVWEYRNSLLFSVSIKQRRDAMWTPCDLPVELISEFVEIIQEVKAVVDERLKGESS